MKNIRSIFMRRTIGALFMLSAETFTFAQNNERQPKCSSVWRGFNGGATFCEVRKRTLSSQADKLAVDGQQNGCVTVKGWHRKETFVRTQIRVWSRTKSQAETRAFASGIEIDASSGGGSFRAAPPSDDNNFLWSADFEISLPFDSNLSLKTFNGAIQISNVRGRIEFDSSNRAISLLDLAGEVRGQTVNGALAIKLGGERWDSTGLDARTVNGFISRNRSVKFSVKISRSLRRSVSRATYSALSHKLFVRFSSAESVRFSVTTAPVTKSVNFG